MAAYDESDINVPAIDELTAWLFEPEKNSALYVGDVTFSPAVQAGLDAIELGIEHVTTFGRTFEQPRRVGFFSNDVESYTYSRNTILARPMPTEIDAIMAQVNAKLGTNFNACLMNRYLDGNHSIGAHADDERGLDVLGVVSIAWGQPRKFRIREKAKKPAKRQKPIGTQAKRKFTEDDRFIDYIHPNRNPRLIWMAGDFQDHFTHEIPKEKTLVNKEGKPVKDYTRTSVTFRNHSV